MYEKNKIKMAWDKRESQEKHVKLDENTAPEACRNDIPREDEQCRTGVNEKESQSERNRPIVWISPSDGSTALCSALSGRCSDDV